MSQSKNDKSMRDDQANIFHKLMTHTCSRFCMRERKHM